MSHKPLTETERTKRREADRARAEQAARQLLNSDGWRAWVRVRARNGLSRYSLDNQLLIAWQYPTATYVAGFRAFLELGRCVRKGERGIRISAPVRASKPDPDPRAEKTTEPETPRIAFRTVSVFDVSQTDPLPDNQPAPLHPPDAPIDGDSHEHLLAPLAELAKGLGYVVDYQLLDDRTGGFCDHAKKRIVVNQEPSPNGQVRILVHEIAHALGITYESHGRRYAEVIVDTTTLIVCGSLGLDTSASSIPYIAGWGEQDGLAAIHKYAALIDTTARHIEDALAALTRHSTCSPLRAA